MANRTSWVAGNGVGLTWTTAFNAGSGLDLNVGLQNGYSILASSTAIANGTNLDQFAAVSFVGALGSSSAIAAGANLAFWLAMLNEDGTTYGDNQLTAGTAFNGTPSWGPPTFVLPLYASTRTSIIGQISGVVLPPTSFLFVMQNNSGFTLATGTSNVCKYITYNQNLND
jgi:hypothetical protein